MVFPEFADPVTHDLLHRITDRKEGCREALAELGVHCLSVETDAGIDQIDMPQLQGDGCAFSGSGQEQEGNQGSVSSLEHGAVGHALN